MIEERLGQTLKHASRHPFYEKKWGCELCDKIKNLEAGGEFFVEPSSVLGDLPVIQRSDLEKVTPYFQEESPIVSVRHTSGTSGEPFYRYRGVKEVEERGSGGAPDNVELALHIVQTYHGGPSTFSTGTIDFFCNVLDEGSLKNSVRLLSEKFVDLGEKQISLIYAPWLHLMLLTSWMIENGVDPKQFAVRKIVAFGGHYSPFIDLILNDFWNGVVEPRYSLSEVGYASAYIKGKGYKLKSTASCLIQLIRLCGSVYKIAFTELYPSGYNQPVIKYSPGDIIRVDDDVFSVLGREKYSLFCDGKLLIGSNQIKDILDKPYIARANPIYNFHGDIAKYAYPIAAKVDHEDGAGVSITIKEDISSEDKKDVIDGFKKTARGNGFNDLKVEVRVDRSLSSYLPK